MKKIKYILIGLFLLFLSYSCDKNFLERYPYGQLSPQIYYKTASDAEYATNACYSYLTKLEGFWAKGYRIYGDYFSDDLSAESMFIQYLRGEYNAADGDLVAGSWGNAYSAIARCNTVLEGIENMTDEMIDTDLKNRYMAEIRFIRGFAYFHIARKFGAVPLILTPVDVSDDAQLYPARTPVAQIYQQAIIPDLEFGAANLPPSYASPVDANRLTSDVAKAYLCLVHLTLKDWANAETLGKAVISSGRYVLLSDFEKILNENYEFNAESVFEISYSKDLQNYNSKYFGSRDGKICRGGVYFAHNFTSRDLRDAFSLIDGSKITDDPLGIYNETNFWENRDPRFDFTYFTALDTFEDINGNTVGYNMDWAFDKTNKVDFQKNTLWYGENVSAVGLNRVEMRYAEVLLNVAEACIMQDKYAETATYINMVRKRARDYALAYPSKYNKAGLANNQILPDITISSQADGLEKLRYERRVEFTQEDKRGYDLCRWGIQAETWAAVQGFAWNDKLKLLPLPQPEMDGNPNLAPNNPGW